jgi:proline racemase
MNSAATLKVESVIPTVTGSAWVTQVSEVVVDPTDPVPDGYTLPDIW